MILTTTALLAFLIVAVAALGIGIFSKRQEVYILGVVVLFFMGLMVIRLGVAEPTGQVLNETAAGNLTGTIVTTTYTTSSDTWTNALGLLFVVIAAGLSLHLYRSNEKEKEKKRDSLDVEE